MYSENVAKNCPKLSNCQKFEAVNGKYMVAENDGGKRFTVTFKADVILCMRRELRGL